MKICLKYKWTPCRLVGLYTDSTWSLHGVYTESTWSLHGVYIDYMESTRSHGVYMESTETCGRV